MNRRYQKNKKSNQIHFPDGANSLMKYVKIESLQTILYIYQIVFNTHPHDKNIVLRYTIFMYKSARYQG